MSVESENTCGTCSHWKPIAGEWDWMDDEDQIVAPSPHPWGSCGLIALPEPPWADPNIHRVNTTAYVQDGSDYKATLYCRSDFGCTLHATGA